jgi:uncharacterized protein YqgC (DUF456 family)
MMIWVWYILLLLLGAAGVFVTIPGLPGLWLLVGAAAVYAWWTGLGAYIGWMSIIALIVLGLIAEVVEFVAGSAGAAKAGGSRRAMIGAIVGALVGGILLSIPLPLVGAIIGACLGAFVGASAVELAIRRDIMHSMRVGTGAAKGRFWGIVTKLAFGIIMWILIAIVAFPLLGGSENPLAEPAVPTTFPATMLP